TGGSYSPGLPPGAAWGTRGRALLAHREDCPISRHRSPVLGAPVPLLYGGYIPAGRSRRGGTSYARGSAAPDGDDSRHLLGGGGASTERDANASVSGKSRTSPREVASKSRA